MSETVIRNGKYNHAAGQTAHTNYALNHNILTIPSTTQANWGGSPFIIDIKQNGIQLHECILALSPGSLTGSTTTGNYPHYIPAPFFIQRVEIVVAGQIIDTNYGLNIFLKNQLFNDDQKRALVNAGMGPYLSPATLFAMTSTPTTWYVPLRLLFTQAHFNILNQNHYVQLRVYLQNLANVVDTTGCTVTTLATSNLTASLIARATFLDSATQSNKLAQLTKAPRDYQYLSELYQPISVQSGVSQTTQNLPNFGNAKIDTLYFVVRPVGSGLTGSNTFNFSQIANFNILSSTGQSLVGGVAIPHALAETEFNRWWSQSSFTSEGFQGLNNSYVYIWSFSEANVRTQMTGQNLGYLQFGGSEQLQIVFNSTLSTGVQIDVFGLAFANLRQSIGGVDKSLV
jgi:hypothetical protein